MIEIGTSWLGVRPADDRRGLVVAEHDQHEVRVAVVLHERDQRAQRVLDRPAVRPRRRCRSEPADSSTGSRLKIEPSPTSFQAISCGIRVHGVWLDTRSTSANIGRRSVFAELEALQGREDVLVGHRRVREGRAAVADVAPVVELVVVVERRPLRPRPVVRRHVADGPPPGALERLAEREAIAPDELVVAPLAVDPDARLQGGVRQPADAAERRRGEEGAAGREAGGLQLPRPRVEDGVDLRRERGALRPRPCRSSRRTRAARPCRAGRSAAGRRACAR